MNNSPLPRPSTELKSTGEVFSPYDTLENLNFQAQQILSLIDKFHSPRISVKPLIEQVKDQLIKLLQCWESALTSRQIQSPSISNLSLSDLPNQKQQEKDSKNEGLQHALNYEEKYKNLEEELKKSEDIRQKFHSYHQDCLRQLNHDLDEIIHGYKQKFKKPENIGNILDELFSEEELEQERQVALGRSREKLEIKIHKLQDSKGEKWDMNLESEDSSGPPQDLEGSELILYDKLHDLKMKVNKLRHEDLDNLGNKENSMDLGFLGSLPVSMQSISSSQSIKVDDLLTSFEINEKPSEPFEFNNKNLTIDEKENFIMTLIEKEGTNGRDVCLEDILSFDASEQKSKPLDNSLSFFEHSSRIEKPQENHKPAKANPLENSKPDLDIKLSPITTPKKVFKKADLMDNISQESSIVMGENNTSSFISENSFLNDDRKKSKILKRSEKGILRRPKISDHDDSNSSIFPPINTSSDDQSFRLPIENKLIRKLPLIPCKPICAPPKDKMNVRGRSLLPIQSSVGSSPKVTAANENPMNKSASPNTVNNIRMRRYKEMTRPFIKNLNKKLVPSEPIGFNYYNGMF